MKKIIETNTKVIPKSKKFNSFIKELEIQAIINNYSSKLKESLLDYLIVRYRRGFELSQWKLMLNKVNDFLHVEQELLDEIDYHTMTGSFIIMSDKFIQSFTKTETNNSGRSNLIF